MLKQLSAGNRSVQVITTVAIFPDAIPPLAMAGIEL